MSNKHIQIQWSAHLDEKGELTYKNPNFTLTRDDFLDLINFLEINPGVKVVKLENCGVNDEFASILAINKTVETLMLSSNEIGPEGAKALANKKGLIKLVLDNNKPGYAGHYEDYKIVKAIANSLFLREVSLLGIKVGKKGTGALIHNRKLTSVNLDHHHVSHENQLMIKKTCAQNAVKSSHSNVNSFFKKPSTSTSASLSSSKDDPNVTENNFQLEN